MLSKREKIFIALNKGDFQSLETELSTAASHDFSDSEVPNVFRNAMEKHDGTQVFDKILLHLSNLGDVNVLEDFRDHLGKPINFINIYLERKGTKELDDALLNFLNGLTDTQKAELRSGRSSWSTQLVNDVAKICSIEVCEKLGSLLMDLPVWAPELGEIIGSRLAKTDKARTFRGPEGNNWLHYCARYPNLARKLVLETAYPDTLIPDDVLKDLVNERNAHARGYGLVPLRLALSSEGASFEYLIKLKDLGAEPNLATYPVKDDFSFHSSYSVLFQFSVYALFGFNQKAMRLLMSSYGPKNKEAAIAAIEAGNAELIEQILSYTKIEDFIVRDDNGANLLHYACGAGFRSIKVVECLLEHRKTANLVNRVDAKGETPLFYAVKNYAIRTGDEKAQFKQVIALLIKHGADEKKLNKESKDCFSCLNANEANEIRALIKQVRAEGLIEGPLCSYAQDVKNGTLNPNSLFIKSDGKTETILNRSLRNWPEKKALFQTLMSNDRLDVEAVGSDGVKALALAKDLENEYALVSLAKKGAKPTFICSPDVQMLLNLVGKLSAFVTLEQLASAASVGSDAKPAVAVSSSTAEAALSSTSTSMGQSAVQER